MIISAVSLCVVTLLPKLWESGVCGLEGATHHEIWLLLPWLLCMLSCGFCHISQLCLSIRQSLHTRVSDQAHVCNVTLVEV